MRDGYQFDWVFAAKGSLEKVAQEKVVQEKWSEEVHRWPLIRSFDGEAYAWEGRYLVLVLRDKLSGIPAMGGIEPLPAGSPTEPPSAASIDRWRDFARADST
jgi:hypothetical protein